MKSAARWREDFDRSFAEAPPGPSGLLEDFLGLRLAGQPFALRLSEVAALQACGDITPYPQAAPALLGLVTQRGTPLPLYDLQALQGLGMAAEPGWLLIARAAPLALAFERFDGHWRLPPQAVISAASLQEGQTGSVLRCDDGLRPLVHLGLLISRLKTALRGANP